MSNDGWSKWMEREVGKEFGIDRSIIHSGHLNLQTCELSSGISKRKHARSSTSEHASNTTFFSYLSHILCLISLLGSGRRDLGGSDLLVRLGGIHHGLLLVGLNWLLFINLLLYRLLLINGWLLLVDWLLSAMSIVLLNLGDSFSAHRGAWHAVSTGLTMSVKVDTCYSESSDEEQAINN